MALTVPARRVPCTCVRPCPRIGAPTAPVTSSDTVPTMSTCTSCGRDDEDTVAVRRVYLVLPDGAPTDPGSIEELAEATVVDEDEDWCATCRDQYPHVLRS